MQHNLRKHSQSVGIHEMEDRFPVAESFYLLDNCGAKQLLGGYATRYTNIL